MSQGVGVAGIYVHDQDEALEFYAGKLGFEVHTDARNGDYRWLTVRLRVGRGVPGCLRPAASCRTQSPATPSRAPQAAHQPHPSTTARTRAHASGRQRVRSGVM